MIKKHIFYPLLFIYSVFQSWMLFPIESTLLSKALYIFSLFIFYVFLAQLHRFVFKIGVIFSLFVTFFIYPTLKVYGEPTFSYIASILYTDSAEAISYIKILPISIFIMLSVLLVFTIVLLRTSYEKLNIRFITPVLFLVLIALPTKKILQYGLRLGVIDDYFNVLPLKRTALVINQLYSVKKDHDYMIEESKKPSSWVIENPSEASLKENFVIVIGESVRRDFLHAYGFPIENTPFINSSAPFLFDNYISIAPKTVMSLSRTLALVKEDDLKKYELNNNIVSLANTIGYETHWISNQGVVGHHNSPTTVIANRSNFTTFLRKGDGKTGQNPMDTEMLPFITDAISKKSSKPKLIIIHMQGSHPYACDRTENKYDEFILSEEISCYNKSIKNTDAFLKEIYNNLEKTEKPFSLVYFSDHGQYTDGKSMLHSQKPIKEAYEVPFIIWNKEKETENKNTENQTIKKISTRRVGTDFLHLLSQMNNIKTKNITKNYHFISDESNEDKNSKVFDTSENLVNFDTLPDNPINILLKNTKK